MEATLRAFVAERHRESDPGPVVLAALVAHGSGTAIHEQVLDVWLEALDTDARAGSIAFGPTCPMSGLAAARSVAPQLGPVNRQLWNDVAHAWPRDRWRTRDVSWADYDLISGPAGMLLNLVAAGAPPRRLTDLCARQLLALCGDEDLAALRLGDGQGGVGNRWNDGRVNTGLAHGVAGVAIALKVALERGLRPAGKLRAALGRTSDWLVSQSYADGRGLRTWAPAGLDGRDPPAPKGRQAWCYGTPGIAWSLWESGRVLGRRDLKDFALKAMASFCAGFDPGFHLDSEPIARLGFCHGAAGTLAVADCFARHARSRPAAGLARKLDRLLCAHLELIVHLAPKDTSLLEGAPGVLSVLLTRRGAPRDWLIPLGLR
ncbi:MAG: lanthionine synthetase LanC family protein [Planctomycetota bacterium]